MRFKAQNKRYYSVITDDGSIIRVGEMEAGQVLHYKDGLDADTHASKSALISRIRGKGKKPGGKGKKPGGKSLDFSAFEWPVRNPFADGAE